MYGEELLMETRTTVLRVARQFGLLLGTLSTVGVLLAAIPAHRPPAVREVSSQQSPTPHHDHASMPGMDMSDEKAGERAAIQDMSLGHDAHNLHMMLTGMRPQTPQDIQRATKLVTQLRGGIEKYKDYHAALVDGYKIFLPNLPQPEYHFTNYRNGFRAASLFDPAQPTSLLYRKTQTGFELIGAMYTMPKTATEDQLNARVPLSVTMWHLHTNLCTPPKDQMRSADWTKFGLRGSISTREACEAAGGLFRPSIFGWMVHVYPYEDELDKIFTMHHYGDGAAMSRSSN
jgi:hypothetical protein